MEVGKLTVQLRESTGKGTARKLRVKGLIPAVCYGPALETPLKLVLNPNELKASLDPEKRRNTVIALSVEGNGKGNQSVTAMLKDFQVDAMSQQVTHVDLVAIDLDKEIETDVRVSLGGNSIGVAEGGTLHIVRRRVRVACKPADIPTTIHLDITELAIGDVRHISDLILPEGVRVMDAERLTVVTCAAPTIEEVVTDVVEGEEGAVADGDEKPADGDDKPAEGDAKPADDKGGDKK